MQNNEENPIIGIGIIELPLEDGIAGFGMELGKELLSDIPDFANELSKLPPFLYYMFAKKNLIDAETAEKTVADLIVSLESELVDMINGSEWLLTKKQKKLRKDITEARELLGVTHSVICRRMSVVDNFRYHFKLEEIDAVEGMYYKHKATVTERIRVYESDEAFFESNPLITVEALRDDDCVVDIRHFAYLANFVGFHEIDVRKVRYLPELKVAVFYKNGIWTVYNDIDAE